MKVYAINGSPRINKNTATLLDYVLQGAKTSENVLVKRIDLYKLNYTGCRSCFACKVKNGQFYGKCAIRDDLYEILDEFREIDAVVFGSPIYYRTITGQLHAFYERLFFPYMQYKFGYPNLVKRKIATACIYTMNVLEDEMIRDGYRQNLELWEMFLTNYFQKPLIFHAFNTYQFDNYDKYECEVFSEKEKASYRDVHFPQDCQQAYELGRELIKKCSPHD